MVLKTTLWPKATSQESPVRHFDFPAIINHKDQNLFKAILEPSIAWLQFSCQLKPWILYPLYPLYINEARKLIMKVEKRKHEGWGKFKSISLKIAWNGVGKFGNKNIELQKKSARNNKHWNELQMKTGPLEERSLRVTPHSPPPLPPPLPLLLPPYIIVLFFYYDVIHQYCMWMPWQPGGEGRLLGDPPCGRGPAMFGLRSLHCVMCYLPHVNKLGLIGIEGRSWGEGPAFNVYSCWGSCTRVTWTRTRTRLGYYLYVWVWVWVSVDSTTSSDLSHPLRVPKKNVKVWSLTTTGGGVGRNHTPYCELYFFLKISVHLLIYPIHWETKFKVKLFVKYACKKWFSMNILTHDSSEHPKFLLWNRLIILF